MNTIKSASLLATLAIFLALFIAACGGGGGGSNVASSGGIGGTGISTTGTVTGFGSVFVNGVEFETNDTIFDVDDDNGAMVTDLGIGMVVTVIGVVNNNGTTGTATSITYDDEIKGPITAAPLESPDMTTKTFDIFDLTVVVDKNSTVFVNTSYAGLTMNDIVGVSGFFDASGNLVATRLEKEGILGSIDVEVKGTVSCGGSPDCSGAFTLGSLAITYDGGTDLTEIPAGVVADGLFVEVKGALTLPASIAASRIQMEEAGLGSDVENASIEGIVTGFNGLNDFMVGGQPVDASGFAVAFQPATLGATIGDGDQVEVEGPIVAGILLATDIEQRSGSVQISAVVDSVNATAGTITVEIVTGQPLVTLTVNSQTQLEDKTGGIGNLRIFDIVAGDFLNIEAFFSGGTLIATQVEREAPGDTELQGPADIPGTSGNSTNGQVSILGVIIQTGSLTQFKDKDGNNIGAAAFFGSVTDGVLITFKDENNGVVLNDGLAEEVGFED